MVVGEGKVLVSTISKPGMFGLVMAPKENFLTYSSQFVFLIIFERLVHGCVVIVAIDQWGKRLITWEWIYIELRENMY